MPLSTIAKFPFVLVALTLLAVACVGGYTPPVSAPDYLLPRVHYSADYPLTLDEATDAKLSPHIYGPYDLEVGQAHQFSLFAFQCCVVARPIKAPAFWSMEAQKGATINAKSGLFTLDADVPRGTEFDIVADVDSGAQTLIHTVRAFSTEVNPLLGRWGGAESGEMGELLLQGGGQFAASWQMLEDHIDLFGTYVIDAENSTTGTVEFTQSAERIETPGFQGTGSFNIDAYGTLTLQGICPDNDGEPKCTHRLVRP